MRFDATARVQDARPLKLAPLDKKAVPGIRYVRGAGNEQGDNSLL
ncbi:MAG: hypothetical protein ACP5R5_11220 [Armatimonadota bacterium]